MIFKRKKKKLENFDAIGLINDVALPLTPYGEKITNSDVVLICIDRIASQCTKLKGRCIKRSEDGIITERNKSLSFLLKPKPNEYMTPYQRHYRHLQDREIQ
nr:MAG TPA: portal protein [Caudoviricetes sp.]